jgi:hypothetical protein
MNRNAHRAFAFGVRSAKAGRDAGVTIAARTPKLIAAGFDPHGENGREARVAVSEKIKAAFDGAVAAQAKVGDLWLRALFGRLSASDAASSWMDVSQAALIPAYRSVRANARRLSK